MNQITGAMEGLKGNSHIPGTLPLPCPLLTMGNPLNIFPFFGIHTKTRQNQCHNHIVIFVLVSTTICSPKLAYFYVIHIYLLFYIFVLVLLVQHGDSNIKFPYIYIKNRWPTLIKEPLWKHMVIKNMKLFNLSLYIYTIFMWRIRFCGHN